MNLNWPKDLSPFQVRIARPTLSIKEITRFYCDGLGLQVLGSFEDHAGYNGVMIGLPGIQYHLEFTEHEKDTFVNPPTKDNLLVLYLGDKTLADTKVKHLMELGYKTIEPENPYWNGKGVLIEDPDGWVVVLAYTKGLS